MLVMGMINLSSTVILTCVKLLVTCVESVLPLCPNSELLSFILVRTIRPSSLCIKPPNQPRLITSLKKS
jgi:hypothetical protein